MSRPGFEGGVLNTSTRRFICICVDGITAMVFCLEIDNTYTLIHHDNLHYMGVRRPSFVTFEDISMALLKVKTVDLWCCHPPNITKHVSSTQN